MKVSEIMIHSPQSCSSGMNLAKAVEKMWEVDCGILPVVDDGGKVIGMITDRDICVALGTRNLLASDMTVGQVTSGKVAGCSPEDDIHSALNVMKSQRRLPVLDGDVRLQGILCMDDIVMRARPDGKELSYKHVVETLKEIYRHVKREPAPRDVAA